MLYQLQCSVLKVKVQGNSSVSEATFVKWGAGGHVSDDFFSFQIQNYASYLSRTLQYTEVYKIREFLLAFLKL